MKWSCSSAPSQREKTTERIVCFKTVIEIVPASCPAKRARPSSNSIDSNAKHRYVRSHGGLFCHNTKAISAYYCALLRISVHECALVYMGAN